MTLFSILHYLLSTQSIFKLFSHQIFLLLIILVYLKLKKKDDRKSLKTSASATNHGPPRLPHQSTSNTQQTPILTVTDDIEQDYLDKMKRRSSRSSSTSSTSSFHSVNNTNNNNSRDKQQQQQDQENHQPFQHQHSVKEKSSKHVPPPLMLLEKQSAIDRTGDSSESEMEDYSTSKILKRIYQQVNAPIIADQVCAGAASGVSASATAADHSASIEDLTGANTLDSYTLHPFVYLHPVIKPPLAEYTSITDCIDTSIIDRPVSPNLIGKYLTFKDFSVQNILFWTFFFVFVFSMTENLGT